VWGVSCCVECRSFVCSVCLPVVCVCVCMCTFLFAAPVSLFCACLLYLVFHSLGHSATHTLSLSRPLFLLMLLAGV
jgi:hypothetical protein